MCDFIEKCVRPKGGCSVLDMSEYKVPPCFVDHKHLTGNLDTVAESPAVSGFTTLTVNLNQKCRIRLFERGIKAYEKYYADLRLEPPTKLKVGDIYEEELWEIMLIFGSYCYMGPKAPFETTFLILGRWQK